jgi:hypothetical protein
MRRRATVPRSIGCAALIVGLTACSASRNEPSAATIGTSSPVVTPTAAGGPTSSTSAVRSTPALAPTGASSAPGSAGSVVSGAPAARPAALDDLEANAEDVIDLVADEGWGKVTDDVAAMEATWAGYRPSAEVADAALAGALAGALDTLRAAAATKDATRASQAANDISRAVVELFAHYLLPRPIQIGRLDVIGRQIALDADTDRLADASEQVVAAREQWSAIRDDVIAHHGDDVATRAAAALSAIDSALAAEDAEEVSAHAATLLEVVDAIEGLY